MARFWKDQFDPDKHHNHMGRVDRQPSSLVRQWVYFVSVCGFTFEFHALSQVADCLKYYTEKVRPSSRGSMWTAGGDRREARANLLHVRWCDRLPQYLLEEPKRQRVVKALERALAAFSSEK